MMKNLSINRLSNLLIFMPQLWKKKLWSYVTIKEVDDEYSIRHAKNLLCAYGSYMYDELQLTAGKDSFYYELVIFPGMKYQKPDGVFLVATFNDEPAGCAAIRRFSNDACEMKRLFVLPRFRNAGVGALLNQRIIRAAKMMGYKKMLLDTNREMTGALKLYKKSGFKEIPPYCKNENPNAVFMELSL